MIKSFRSKVIIYIIAISVMTAFTISLVFYRQQSQVIKENYIYTISNNVTNTIDIFEEFMQRSYSTCVYLSTSEELINMINIIENTKSDDEITNLSNYLKTYQQKDSWIDSIYVYIPSDQRIVTSTPYKASEKIFEDSSFQWIELIENEYINRNSLNPMKIMDNVSSIKKNVVTYSRPIKNKDEQAFGEVCINIDERNLYYKLLDNLSQNKFMKAYLLDATGKIISAGNSDLINRNIKDIIGNYSEDVMNYDSYNFNYNYNGDDMLGVFLNSPLTQYKILCTSNYNVIFKNMEYIRRDIILLCLIVVILTILFVFITFGRMYEPINNLKITMKAVGDGDLTLRARIFHRDEIGQIATYFNSMLDQVEGLIGQLVEEKLSKKEIELEALQYQITPHFMYNTLNSIKYAALLQKANSIAEMLTAFIELLQASINKKGTFITLEEESKLLDNYVKLQRFRYMNSFAVEYYIPEDTKDYYVPRLILQPLVENAILHGIDIKKNNNKVQVNASVNEEKLILSVKNEGRGISEEQVKLLLENNTVKRNGLNGIGISNIKQRLHLYYGDNASLQYIINSDISTTVVITMPVSKSQDEYMVLKGRK